MKKERIRRLFLGVFLIIISWILLYKALSYEVIDSIQMITNAIVNSNLTIHIFLDSAWHLFIVAPIVIIALLIVFVFGFYIIDE